MKQNIDTGPDPIVFNIESATLENTNYRTALWTGSNLQITVMSIDPGCDIGLEAHETHDQFLRIEQGKAMVVMGNNADNLNSTWQASDDYAVVVPAGVWHNLTNIGNVPLKLYSIYAPAEHPQGTVHVTKKDADEAEAAKHHK